MDRSEFYDKIKCANDAIRNCEIDVNNNYVDYQLNRMNAENELFQARLDRIDVYLSILEEILSQKKLDEEASYDLKELYQNILISANYLELTKQDLDEATDDVAMELNKFPADRVESIPAEIKRQEVLSIINETCEMCESKWQKECKPIINRLLAENELGGE